MTSKLKMTTMTTASEQVAGNSYLLEEILVRLPPKSVTRSKLVSKQWLSQISDSRFVQRHSQQPTNNKLLTGMFVTDDECDCRDANFVSFSDELIPKPYQTIPSLGFLYDAIVPPDDDGIDLIEIIDSCNGLVLCHVNWSMKSSHDYCVCNPTTKTFRLLPTRPVHSCRYPKYINYLAFDPCVSLHYKVICTISGSNDYWELHMYSSEDQLWKKKFGDSPFHPSGRGFFFNGSIYWLSGRTPHCFDLYNDDMKPIELLSQSPHPCLWTYLDLVGSRLKAKTTIDFCVGEVSSEFLEWVIKSDARSVRPLLYSFPQIALSQKICDCFSDLCVVECGKEDESQLVLGIPGKLILYSLKKKTAKELYDLQGELGDQYGYKNVRVFQFIETLSVV